MSIAIPLTVLPSRISRGAAAITPITVFGTLWSVKTHRICRYLRQAQAPFTLVNLDLRPDAEAYLREVKMADAAVPVVYVDGVWLASPSFDELESALSGRGWMTPA